MANAPQRDRTAGVKKLICLKCEAEYFFERDWTDRNSLNAQDKFDFTRKSWIASSLRSSQ